MAAGNISSAAILAAAKESTAKIQGKDWIDIITNMANSGYSNNKRDNWFRTEGNTVSGSSTDTATTETVVDVAKVVKTLTKGENVATVDFDGVVSYVKTVDLLAGILRVMGFYDSKDVTVEKYAKELLNQIDFSNCDKLSEDEIRTIISYLNSDAKILVEKVAINDLYNQLVALGVTKSSGVVNGGVASPDIKVSTTDRDYIEVSNGPYYDGIGSLNNLQQYNTIRYDTFVGMLPTDIAARLAKMVIKLRSESESYYQYLFNDNIDSYIFISTNDSNFSGSGSVNKGSEGFNVDIYFCNKSDEKPYIGFDSSAFVYVDGYYDPDLSHSSTVLYKGGDEIINNIGATVRYDYGDDVYLNLPSYFSWCKSEVVPRVPTEEDFRIAGSVHYYEKVAGIGNIYGFENNDYNNLSAYRKVLGHVFYRDDIYHYDNDREDESIFFYDPNSNYNFNQFASSGQSSSSNGILEYNVSSSTPTGGFVISAYDNLAGIDGSLPEEKTSVDKPNFKSRVDTSNNDLVSQLNMTTKNYGRYGTEGKIGDTVYAVFNSTAGDSSSSDENVNANKITDGGITKDQKDTIADDTSDANDSTKEEDKTGETTGTSNDDGIIPHIDFSYIAKRSMFNLYQVNQTTIKTLTDFLWSETFANQMLKLYSNPMEAILGLYVLPVAPSDVTQNVNVYIGNVDLNVNATLVNSYQQTYTAGVIDIAHYNHDVRDYSPYSQYYLYLPFIGIVELNADDVVGSKLTIYYDFDLCTGSILARIWVSRGGLNACLYQFTGSCIYRLPVTQFDQANLITVAANASLSALAGGLTGGPVRAGAQAVQQGFNSLQSHVTQGGSIGGNASIVASPYPYVIIKHRTPQTPSNFNKFYGRPTLKTVTLSKEKGFVKVKDINLHNVNLASDELNELESILKEGVIL